MGEVEELLRSLREIQLADFYSDPTKVLGFIERYAPGQCDNSPLFYSISLDAGETFLYTVNSPQGMVAINISTYFDVSVANVLDITVYLDGRPYVTAPSGKATAGGVEVKYIGWLVCGSVLYQVKNNHSGTVVLYVIATGAYLAVSIWDKLKKVLVAYGERLATEGKIG